ncbi:AEC family transporter [Ignatzschineria sp. LJL83]
MNGIILIITCLIAGKILTRSISCKAEFIYSLNRVAIMIALPALILDKVHSQAFSAEAIFPLLSPWLLFLLTIILVYIVKIFVPMSHITTGTLILLAGTANTSFVGIPLIQAMMGTEEYLGIALWVDQSNFILLFTLGVFVADFYSGSKTSISKNLRSLATYPPIIALIFAFLLKPFTYPAFISYTLETLGSLITPLTMISVGASLSLPRNRRVITYLSIGLSIKLIILPLAVLTTLLFIYASPNIYINQIVLMQAGMAPMVVAAIIAVERGLDGELASIMTAIGIPISFITIPLFYYLVI